MKLSSFNWPHVGRRGWIVGPFLNKCIRIEIPTRKASFGFNIALYDWGAR